MKAFLAATFLVSMSSAVQAESLDFNCTILDQNQRATVVTASSGEFTFARPFTGIFTPTTSLVLGEQPNYFVLTDASITKDDRTEEVNLFVSDWVGSDQLSEQAIGLLSNLELELSSIDRLRVAFPTDLAQSFAYVEINTTKAETIKTAVAGLFPGVCE